MLFERLALSLPGLGDYVHALDEIPVVVLTPRRVHGDLPNAASELRSLHRRGEPLVLVNVWDAASAARVAAVGARAVATSSAAIAASLGVPDDPSAPVDDMFAAVRRIAAAVDLPVTADLLDGYGLDPDDLVDRLLAAGGTAATSRTPTMRAWQRFVDPAQAAQVESRGEGRRERAWISSSTPASTRTSMRARARPPT